MDNKIMEQIESQLCDILRDKAQRGIGAPSDVETVKNALSAINKIKIITAMERYAADDRSYAAYPEYDGYRRGRMAYYDDGYGRYHSRDDYETNHSGHSMRERLEQMMREAGNDREKMALREALQKM